MDQNLKTYTFDEALKTSTEYFHGDTLAATVFLNKYAIRDENGGIIESTPEDMHHRLAKEFARIEARYPNPRSEEEIYSYLKDFKYIVPGGSPMAGIGNKYQKFGSLSNCFVLPSPHDSIISCFNTCAQLGSVFRYRGGAGIDISALRPDGAFVNNSARTSSGMVSFMQLFSTAASTIGTNGRRSALMITSSIDHIDSEQFIKSKDDLSKITSANISLRIGDKFMEAVEKDEDYELKWPVDSDTPTYTKTIKSKKLWNTLIHQAWKSAEPGVLFWDTITKESVPDCYADFGFKTISTNPCGEVTLCKSDSCRLLSINLFNFVEHPFTEKASFNFEKLKEVVILGQRLLDDLVDLEFEKIDIILNKLKSDPEPEEIKSTEIKLWESIKEKGEQGRRTGLGITALGDMIAAMGLRYGTKEATEFATKVQKTICLSAYKSSSIMAKERGSFPIYDYKREIGNPFIERIKENDAELYDSMVKYGRRNIACLTIAPTGSVSIMTQTSSGIEPVFMPVYTRRRKVNPGDLNAHVDFVDNVGDAYEEFIVFHPKFKTWMETNGYDTEKKYSQKEIDELISKSPYYKATANDIDFIEKVKMQGAVQKFVDHSISVTVNMPKDVTEETVRDVYMTAWKAGCKGCTIYRDGSRNSQPLSASSKKEDKKSDNKVIEDRPVSLTADVLRFKNNRENWIAFVGKLPDGSPYEIFTGLVDDENGIFELPKTITSGHIVKRIKEDGTKSYDFEFENKRGTKVIVEGLNAKFNPEFWNYSKLLSSVLRYKMPMNHVLHLVESLDIKEDSINSWKSGVTRALKKFVKDGDDVVGGEKCPDCGGKLTYQDGCVICLNCGYSRCG